MWTRKDMKEFKEQIRKEKDAVIKVGSGETVTVRIVFYSRLKERDQLIDLGSSSNTRRWSMYILGIQYRLL